MSDLKFVIQYEDSNGVWRNVNGVQYETYGEALVVLGKNIAADPEYTHRLVRLVKEVDVVIVGSGGEE